MDNLFILFYHRASEIFKNASYAAMLVQGGVRDCVRYEKILALVIKLVSGFLAIQVMVPGRQNTLLLQPLLSDTEYKVTITPIYSDGEGVSVSAPGKTRECRFSSCLWPGYACKRLTLLALVIYYSINMGLHCITSMTRALHSSQFFHL